MRNDRLRDRHRDNDEDIEETKEKTIKALNQHGRLSHSELTDWAEEDEFEVQKAVRDLRNEGKLSITLDRKYELEDEDSLTP